MRISSSSQQMSPGNGIGSWLYWIVEILFHPIARRIFSLIFFLAYASFAFFVIRQPIRAKASVEWPTAQGKIVESSVECHKSLEENGATSENYRAKILYKFSVDGMNFNGNRVAYGDGDIFSPGNQSNAKNVVNRYPKGKAVTAYYLPGNPEESLLEPGFKWESWLYTGSMFALITVGYLLIGGWWEPVKRVDVDRGPLAAKRVS